jgi:glycosyltransferase involved in cell wall biosynthesis
VAPLPVPVNSPRHMQALVTCNARFVVTPDGRLWVANRNRAHAFWTRYLEVFDSLRILGRSKPAAEPPPDWHEATGSQVQGAPVPDFGSPLSMARHYPAVRRQVRSSLAAPSALFLHAPDMLANLVWPLIAPGRPYGVEVVGDPYDVFAPRAIKFRLRPVYRWWFTTRLKQQCRSAAAAAYVTSRALQARYPCPRREIAVSDVDLPAEAMAAAPRTYAAPLRRATLVAVGSLEQPYKAIDILLAATALGVKEGLDLSLIVVGDGRFRTELEQLARSLGIAERVRFAGQVATAVEVRALLDQGDIFVLPSYTEGLPRALVEAMARGLPCLGSNVGGIPELLAPEYLCTAGDAKALASMILRLLASPERLTTAAAAAWRKAAEFQNSKLQDQRLEFFREIEANTAAWLSAQR